jgi:hypothetical protein
MLSILDNMIRVPRQQYPGAPIVDDGLGEIVYNSGDGYFYKLGWLPPTSTIMVDETVLSRPAWSDPYTPSEDYTDLGMLSGVYQRINTRIFKYGYYGWNRLGSPPPTLEGMARNHIDLGYYDGISPRYTVIDGVVWNTENSPDVPTDYPIPPPPFEYGPKVCVRYVTYDETTLFEENETWVVQQNSDGSKQYPYTSTERIRTIQNTSQGSGTDEWGDYQWGYWETWDVQSKVFMIPTHTLLALPILLFGTGMIATIVSGGDASVLGAAAMAAMAAMSAAASAGRKPRRS